MTTKLAVLFGYRYKKINLKIEEGLR